jgi:UDP-N-acetyl-D-galactosamine dehydrogenase
LPFKPGLVGGHCIGGDPYYLTHKAQMAGHQPEIILAGRKINDTMPAFVAGQVEELLQQRQIPVQGAKVLVLGIAFKENCADVRNSRSAELVRCLQKQGNEVSVYDPLVSVKAVLGLYGYEPVSYPEKKYYQAIILRVGHEAFQKLEIDPLKALGGIIFKLRSFYERSTTDGRL